MVTHCPYSHSCPLHHCVGDWAHACSLFPCPFHDSASPWPLALFSNILRVRYLPNSSSSQGAQPAGVTSAQGVTIQRLCRDAAEKGLGSSPRAQATEGHVLQMTCLEWRAIAGFLREREFGGDNSACRALLVIWDAMKQ